MISVTVYINNVPIITRSARNVATVEGTSNICRYKVDDGREVLHARNDGAAKLAIRLLEDVVQP